MQFALLNLLHKIPRISHIALTNVSSRSFGVLKPTLNVVSSHLGNQSSLLRPSIPSVSQSCGMKVKGLLKRRCKDCYIVIRDQRTYIMCKSFPRHKQMSMVEKPHNTWILTHATQGPFRQW